MPRPEPVVKPLFVMERFRECAEEFARRAGGLEPIVEQYLIGLFVPNFSEMLGAPGSCESTWAAVGDWVLDRSRDLGDRARSKAAAKGAAKVSVEDLNDAIREIHDEHCDPEDEKGGWCTVK